MQPDPMPRHFALIPAAGSGSRIGGATPKQYLPLNGRPMLWHAVRIFLRHPRIDGVYVVLSPADTAFAQLRWEGVPAAPQPLRCGGDSRAGSVLNGLRALSDRAAPDDWILVHDAARPCLSASMIDALIDAVGGDPAGGLLAEPVADTLKRSDESGRVRSTEERKHLWRAQTPQMFPYAVLVRALEASLDGVTDEASAVERTGLQPRLVQSAATNLKVTYGADLKLAELILGARTED
jgi:2-C-methyl-D-erythritol 4-phosphate cytidylyltransferase